MTYAQGGPKNRTCLNIKNFATISNRKACNMSKVSECSKKARNLHSRSFKYSLPSLHKSLFPPKPGVCLRSHVSEFIEVKNLLPSPDFKSVCYSVWGHCIRLYGHKISKNDQLKRMLNECWAQLIVNTFTPAIVQLPKN